MADMEIIYPDGSAVVVGESVSLEDYEMCDNCQEWQLFSTMHRVKSMGIEIIYLCKDCVKG